jgi:hypothetical protein|tara:strand:+ start:3177 stop:3293 length:117 start_codon:yes stop_codon:yes gene_type:complete
MSHNERLMEKQAASRISKPVAETPAKKKAPAKKSAPKK